MSILRLSEAHFACRFPAQESVGGDSKIPSILYYNKEGSLCAVGAEALQDHVIEDAEDEGWVKLEWSTGRTTDYVSLILKYSVV